MNNAIQLEDRVSRSRSKHEGESSAEVCDRLSRTRVSSQRQLPTDHDYAVPTREYQLDQSSPLPATAAADPVLEKTNTKTHPSDSKMLTGSHHITSELATIRPELRNQTAANGAPFAAIGQLGLVEVLVGWMKLGIVHRRIHL